ncbi:hypothetical protein KFK09_008027 [Dendrobium nobile]|uniref:Non-specific serine/threonine protein kinase n=1 Tax=Dendrobium nobile TaxID=94219 RepID=A0A8T3BY56_DENNO|nr:hypothetical protein KFK09_008027 [Dendrobium nobile]
MLSLIDVNFSNNQLSGPVPIFAPFQKSPPSSFLGNKNLCGDPLSTYFPSISDTAYENNHHKSSYKMVLAVIGSGLAIFFSLSSCDIVQQSEKESKSSDIGAEEIPVDSPLVITGNVLLIASNKLLILRVL